MVGNNKPKLHTKFFMKPRDPNNLNLGNQLFLYGYDRGKVMRFTDYMCM